MSEDMSKYQDDAREKARNALRAYRGALEHARIADKAVQAAWNYLKSVGLRQEAMHYGLEWAAAEAHETGDSICWRGAS